MQRLRIAALAVVVAARSGAAQTPSTPHFFLLDRRGNGLDLSGTNKALGLRWTTAQTDDAFLAVDSTGLRAMGIDVTTREHIRLDGPTLASTNLHIVIQGQSRDIDRTWQLLDALDANGDGRTDVLGNVLTESWVTTNDRRSRTSADVAFAKLPPS